jgi:hypothetical protein
MISTTLLVMAASLLTRGIAAASAPVCVSSSEGYPVGQVNYLFNSFCNQLATNNFATEQQIYGTPLISFDYTSASGSAACDLNNCLASYQTLVSSCMFTQNTNKYEALICHRRITQFDDLGNRKFRCWMRGV